jgi:hypothetical protein
LGHSMCCHVKLLSGRPPHHPLAAHSRGGTTTASLRPQKPCITKSVAKVHRRCCPQTTSSLNLDNGRLASPPQHPAPPPVTSAASSLPCRPSTDHCSAHLSSHKRRCTTAEKDFRLKTSSVKVDLCVRSPSSAM